MAVAVTFWLRLLPLNAPLQHANSACFAAFSFFLSYSSSACLHVWRVSGRAEPDASEPGEQAHYQAHRQQLTLSSLLPVDFVPVFRMLHN
jgi:hypothetical protein